MLGWLDIVEGDIKYLYRHFNYINDDPMASIKMADIHADVDLGRAVKFETKVRKVLESL